MNEVECRVTRLQRLPLVDLADLEAQMNSWLTPYDCPGVPMYDPLCKLLEWEEKVAAADIGNLYKQHKG